MTAILKVWRHIRNQTPSTDAYLFGENNPVKFHPNPIWNDGAFGLFEPTTTTVANNHKNKNNKMSSDKDQFPIKNYGAVVTE